MSEKSPQNQNLNLPTSPEKTPDGLEMDASRAQLIANHIHEHSEGEGTTPEVVDELYEELELLKAGENSKETTSDEETTPATEEKQSERVRSARGEVGEAIEKPSDDGEKRSKPDEPEPSPEVDPSDDPDNPTEITEPMEPGSDIKKEEGLYTPEIQSYRQSILDRIDEADKINNKDKRTEALSVIAKQHTKPHEKEEEDINKFTFPDLAIEAARRIRNSKFHTGLKAKRLGRTKEFGVTNDTHDQLLLEISNANADSEYGVEAAKNINMPWLRNETLQSRSKHAIGKLSSLQTEVASSHEDTAALDKAIQDLNKYTDIATTSKEQIKGWHSWKYKPGVELFLAKETLGPDYLSVLGLRHFMKKEQTLSEIAIKNKDEKIAAAIMRPLLRRKTIDEVRRLNSK